MRHASTTMISSSTNPTADAPMTIAKFTRSGLGFDCGGDVLGCDVVLARGAGRRAHGTEHASNNSSTPAPHRDTDGSSKHGGLACEPAARLTTGNNTQMSKCPATMISIFRVPLRFAADDAHLGSIHTCLSGTPRRDQIQMKQTVLRPFTQPQLRGGIWRADAGARLAAVHQHSTLICPPTHSKK